MTAVQEHTMSEPDKPLGGRASASSGTDVIPDGLLLEFTVPGNPRPKERPRFNGHAYTAKDTAGAEFVVGWEARKAMGHRKPLPIDLWVEIDFVMDSKRRVDLDNLAKLVLDALNEVVWADDSQVERLTLTRAVDRTQPRTEVRVFARGESVLRG